MYINSTKEKIDAFRRNKMNRQFMATLQGFDSEEDNREELPEGLNNPKAHIIDVLFSDNQPDDEKIFSHMTSIDDEYKT